MKRLRAGATAVQAVEAAIKVLENNEITNAGYGSNLSIEGMVECDATMVDHFGRSGACGAVPSKTDLLFHFGAFCVRSLLKSETDIKNPISLAKLILDTSSKTLSLRRVPPNFLVGDGAKQFAIEHGMSLVTNEQLTSRNANDRYQKWRADLQRARGEAPTTTSNISSPGQAPSTDRTKVDERSQDQMTPRTKAHKGLQRDHTSAILNGMWNEGQPDSPSSDPNSLVVTGSDAATPTKTRSPLSGVPNSTKRLGPGSSACASDTSLAASPAKRVKTLKDERARLAQDESKWMSKTDATDDVISVDGFSGGDTPIGFDLHRASQPGTPKLATTELTAEPNDADFDLITDTMGAIAIDALGNIAAGSSSGGIGMKHMGRTGPAALVGIGTAVIPVDEEDEEGRTVAAVTSGTGEHMATTMAAQKCAERLFHRTRRGPAGRDVPEDDDSIVMRSFVLNDFMGHPGVRSQASARAIGVMAIEVTNKGIYLNWAHNTESFALASMGSYEKTPCTVMSRLPEGHGVNIGARKIFNLGQPPDR